MVKERFLVYRNTDGQVHKEPIGEVKIPGSWQGATSEQQLNSAQAVKQHSRDGDPRMPAAELILEKFGQKGRG